MSNSHLMNQIGIHLRQALPFMLMASFILCGQVLGQESPSLESPSLEYVSTAYHPKLPSRKSIQQISDKIDALVNAETF